MRFLNFVVQMMFLVLLIECQTTNTGSTNEVSCNVDIVTSFTECQKPEVLGSTESLPVDSQEKKRNEKLN